MPYKKSNQKSEKSKDMKKIAKKEVKLALNQELETKKFFARQNPTLNITNAGLSINPLQDPALAVFLTQGTARNQFLGDTIDPIALKIDYIMTSTLSAGSYCTFRVMVVQAKGGGTPSATNVLSSVGNIMTPYSDIDPIYQDTFTVLYDKKHLLVQGDRNTGKGSIYIASKRLRKINFNSTSASAISNNALALLVYTDYSSGTGTNLFGYQSCLYFKDA